MKKIVPLIPEHTCYCEVFAGGAWVFFSKEPSKVEVINDINLELVTLYRVVQNHLDEFLRYLRWILPAREEYRRFMASAPETLTDVQRAVRFYFLIRMGFGGRMKSPTYGYGTTRRPHFDLTRIGEDLSAAHLRLSRVYIESLPWSEIVKRYDRPHTFFYLDPPYWGGEEDYGKGLFSREDFAEIADLLSTIKGSFLLSINARPETREIFKSFNVRGVTTTYNLAKGTAKTGVKELLVANYQI